MKIVRLLWLVPATIALIAVAALVPALGDDEPALGEAHVEVSGVARVTRSGGGVEQVRGSTELRRGDGLVMLSGTAELELHDGVDYEAKAGDDARESTSLTMGTVPVLRTGELLVTAEDDASIEAAGTRVSLQATGGPAALKLSRSRAVGVEVYRGVADVDSAGDEGRVPAFRQLEVAAFGDVPRQPEPLAFSSDDGWDRRFLREAIAVDQQLQPLLTTFGTVAPPAGETASFLRSVLPTPPAADVLQPLLDGRTDEADTLVGAGITDLSSEPASFTAAWEEVFSFHDDGATWGLVALDRAVAEDRLTDLVDGALENEEVALPSGDGPDGAPSSLPDPSDILAGASTSTTTTPVADETTTTTTTTTEPDEGITTTTEQSSRTSSTTTTTTTTTPTTESTTTTTSDTTPPTEPRTSTTTEPTTTTTTLPPTTAAVPVGSGPPTTAAEDGATAAVIGATAGG